MRRTILAAAMVLLAAAGARAQDSNYWDTQYGTKGGMLGGLVVGSPSDLSATFYNPGWIAMDVDGTFLLTTQAVEGYRLKLRDGLGPGLDLESTVFSTSPDYLAGRFTLDPRRTWSWAYSYLKRVQFDFEVRGVQFDPRLLPPTGTPWFSGEAFRKAKSDEYWYGLTAARRLRPDLALGFTPYAVYRSIRSRIQTAAQGVGVGGNFAQGYMADEYRFWNLRLLAKIGLALDRGNWTMGATLTTPSLGIMGSGESLYQVTGSGYDRDGDGIADPPFATANYQEKLDASWKSPLSLALGATWKPGRTGYHATVEWFNAVSRRSAIEPEPFTDQSTGETVDITIAYAAKRVFNFGVGVEHDFTEDFSLYGAFRSDYTSNPGDGSDGLALSSWNLWHVSTGAAFRFLNLEFNTGLQLSWGAHDEARIVNFNPDQGETVTGEVGTYRMTYRRIKVLVGFNLPMLAPGNPPSGVAP